MATLKKLPKGKLTPVILKKEIIEREIQPSIFQYPEPEKLDYDAILQALKSDPNFLKQIKGEKGDPGLGAGGGYRGGEGKTRVQDLPGYKDASNGDVFGIDKNGNIGFFPRHELGDISVTVTSTSYNAVIGTPVILVDAETAGDNVTITLPAVADAVNMMFYIKKLDQTNKYVRVDGNGGELIDGDTYFDLELQHESIRVYSNGSFWSIL